MMHVQNKYTLDCPKRGYLWHRMVHNTLNHINTYTKYILMYEIEEYVS